MNGKVLKVKENNLEFGVKDRFVNALGCFKYKQNGNTYIVYTDIETKYNIVHYGSCHIRQGVCLCMTPRDKSEEEIIKEYLFKVTNKEELDNFEIYSLEETETLEIIASEKIEVKSEVLNELINIVLPKEIKEDSEEVINNKVKKKKGSKFFVSIIIVILIAGALYYGYNYYLELTSLDKIEKSITCNISYLHDELNTNVEESKKYNFNKKDELVNIEKTLLYKFDENTYNDFIFKGTYYKYMPSSSDDSWEKNDTLFTFKVITKEKIDTSYNEPTSYEGVLSDSNIKGYICSEEISS